MRPASIKNWQKKFCLETVEVFQRGDYMKIKCDKTVKMWDIMALILGFGACAVIIWDAIETHGEVTANAMIAVATMSGFFCTFLAG